LLLLDAHVHIHHCFAIPRFLAGAHRQFRARAGAERARFALALTEIAGVDRFDGLREQADGARGSEGDGGTWSFHRTTEPDSLEARADDGRRLWLVAGRQVITAEAVEVLALATAERFPDGEPLPETVARIRGAGAIPVLPWAVGKWLGRRGALVEDYVRGADPRGLWLGDNGGRPRLWARPRLFDRAAERGIGVLPGSDPLPLPDACERAGSFGSALSVDLDETRPAASLRDVLRDAATEPEPYGPLERALPFLRNQLAMQRAKRQR